LVQDLFKLGGRFFKRTSDPPREILELNLVTLIDGQFEDYIQGIYDEREARQELLANRFQLRGEWYDLIWLTGSEAQEVLDRFFRESASDGL
jgi:hypothetical protein